MEDLKVGSVVKGEVTGIESYGIFVKLDEKHSGLVHISQISDKFVENVNNYANIGETIYVEIKELDTKSNKCILSIKDLNYRIDENRKVKESVRGFSPLKRHLPIWVEEKMKELRKEG